MGRGVAYLLGINLLFSVLSGQVSATSLTTDLLTMNGTNDHEADLNSAGHVVWSGWDGHDYEIYYWDGTTTTKLTDNTVDDVSPKINASNHVVWAASTGNGSEIYYWNGTATTRLTNNSTDNKSPQINDKDQVVWSGWDGNDYEIYYWDGATTTQLTDNLSDDISPQINNKNQVVWSGWDGNDYEIYYWDGATTLKLTDNSADDLSPQINDKGQVVWSGWDGNDFEIYFWDGTTTTQLTDNAVDDLSPQINSRGHVVWSASDGNDSEIFYWNGTTTTQLTDNSTDDLSPQINTTEQMVWTAFGGTNSGSDSEIVLANLSVPDKVGLFRKGGTWYLDLNTNGQWNPGIDATSIFGAVTGDKPVAGDWTGDGYSKRGIYRSGTWYLDLNDNGVWDGAPTDKTFKFGQQTDIPVVGDWTGIGKKSVGVYRQGYWYLDLNDNGVWDGTPTDRLIKFGQPTDLPVVGDWAGTGKDSVGVYRQGYWYLDVNDNGAWDGEPTDKMIKFGQPTDIPVVGDWNGNGGYSIGVYRQGYWYLDMNGNGVWDNNIDRQWKFGQPTDIPLVGNFFNPGETIQIDPGPRKGLFVISAAKGNTSEAGPPTTFTVRLGSAPTADVFIPVSSSDLSEGTVDKTGLTFTSTNWRQDQTVTVTGVSDKLADGSISYTVLLGTTVSADSVYNGLDPADVPIVNTDVRTAGFDISKISGNTRESGTPATFQIRLASQPTAAVTIPVRSSDLTEGTVDKSSLIFTNTDWDVEQTVTVTGVNDKLADGPITYDILLGPTESTDSLYNHLNPASVSVTNVDVRSAGFDITPISGNTSESGIPATFQMRLTSQPTDDVTIPVSSADPTEGIVDKSSLTFTNTNWNGYQTVTVTGVADLQDDGSITYNILLGPTESTDNIYNALNLGSVSVTNDDVPTGPGGSIFVSKTSLEVDDSGASASFTVALIGTPPIAEVTIPVSSSDLTEGTVAPASLVFPAGSVDPQTVTVTGVRKTTDGGNKSFTIVLGAAVSTDRSYSGFDPVDVIATNVDLASVYSVSPAISAGSAHSLVLANDGTVWGWGSCGSGQLDTTSTCSSSFALPQKLNITRSSAISAGFGYSVILKDNGTVWTSGSNNLNQLGHAPSASLAPVDNLSEIKIIAAGFYHALAIRNDGTVWAWGKGLSGQLGNGQYLNSATPVQSTGALAGKVITAVAAGTDYSLALDNSGKAYSWGTDNSGQLGNSTGDDTTPSPTVIGSLSGISVLGAGQEQSFAVGTSGSTFGAYAWGFNSDIQLGTALGSPKQLPTIIKPPFDATLVPSKIDGSDFHTVALGPSGEVYTWGDNESKLADSTEKNDTRGALGTGAAVDINGNPMDATEPTLAFNLPSLGNPSPGAAMDVNAGSNFTLVLFTDGSIQASGVNTTAQLGSNEVPIIGENNYTATPVYVEDPDDPGPGSVKMFFAYRPILAGYPTDSTTNATATVTVCPSTLTAPANCGPITYYNYSTDHGTSWSTATSITEPIRLQNLPAGTVNLWVKGMNNNLTELQSTSSAVKVAWTVK